MDERNTSGLQQRGLRRNGLSLLAQTAPVFPFHPDTRSPVRTPDERARKNRRYRLPKSSQNCCGGIVKRLPRPGLHSIGMVERKCWIGERHRIKRCFFIHILSRYRPGADTGTWRIAWMWSFAEDATIRRRAGMSNRRYQRAGVCLPCCSELDQVVAWFHHAGFGMMPLYAL